MKKIMCLLAVLSLSACGGDNNNESSGNEKNGTFKATMDGKTINVAVKCHYFDSDQFDTAFTFASDNVFGNKDTDGDGNLDDDNEDGIDPENIIGYLGDTHYDVWRKSRPGARLHY